MPGELNLSDVMKFMPTLIEVVQVEPALDNPRRTSIQLCVGDKLKVLGLSAPRVTKGGVRTFLR